MLCRPDVLSDSRAARAEFVEQVRSVGVPVFRITAVFERPEPVASALRARGFVMGEDETAEREARWLRERTRAAKTFGVSEDRSVRVLAFSNLAHTLGTGSLFDRIATELGAVSLVAEHGVGPCGSITSEQVAA